jgi:F-box protein 18 (helicase)
MLITPTHEQRAAAQTRLEAGQIMLVNAYAGTGKTETLRLIAEANPGKQLLYLSFNKQTAEKAKKRFPRNTDCRTIHSLAFREVGKRYANKLGTPTARDVMQRFDVAQPYMAVLALEAITRFCHSTERHLGKEHLEPWLRKKYPEVLPLAEKIWDEMQDLDSPICMPHDGYLKLWSLELPRIGSDIILLDEAQDTNPVTLKILLDQMVSETCSLVFVGDSHQAIYAWRGAINSMDSVRKVADHIRPLTISFRFTQQIATNASKVLNYYKGDPVSLTGKGPSQSSLPPECIIGRCNGSLLAHAIPVVKAGGTVHFAGTAAKDHWDPYYLYELQIPLDLLLLRENRLNSIRTPQIRAFRSYTEVADQIRGDGQGAGIDRDLEKHVKLVTQYGTELPDLIDRLRRCSRAPDVASVSLSTAHRSKGLEWRRVEMLDDFVTLRPAKDSTPFDSEYLEEINLLYVAMTRGAEQVQYPDQLQKWLATGVFPEADA